MNENDTTALSPAGRIRRAAILELARRASRTRRRRRIMARAGGLGLCFLIALMLSNVRPAPRSGPLVVDRSESVIHTTLVPPRGIVITRVQTDPTLLSRLAIPPQKPSWKVIDDGELLRGLAEAGRPAGLAYIDGRATLMFREAKTH